jgi:hypothetical protein
MPGEKSSFDFTGVGERAKYKVFFKVFPWLDLITLSLEQN